MLGNQLNGKYETQELTRELALALQKKELRLNNLTFYAFELIDGKEVNFFYNGIDCLMYVKGAYVSFDSLSAEYSNFIGAFISKIKQLYLYLEQPIMVFCVQYGKDVDGIKYTNDDKYNISVLDVKLMTSNTYLPYDSLKNSLGRYFINQVPICYKGSLKEACNLQIGSLSSYVAFQHGITNKAKGVIIRPSCDVIYKKKRIALKLTSDIKTPVCERFIEQQIIDNYLCQINIESIVAQNQDLRFHQLIIIIAGEIEQASMSEGKMLSYLFIKQLTAKKLKTYKFKKAHEEEIQKNTPNN